MFTGYSESMGDFRTGRHVVYSLHAHIVLVPKYRRKIMHGRVAEIVEAVTREVCDRRGVVLEAFNTDQDHCHLLVAYPPKVSLSSLVGSIKTMTSRAIHDANLAEVQHALRGPAFWSPSYCVVSCGGAPLEVVAQYVRDQGREPRKQGRQPRSAAD